MLSDRFGRETRWLAAALLAICVGGAAATAAAPAADDDVRCLLLSSGYTRLAKDDASRRGPAMTGAFYLGRLSGRLSDAALTTVLRAQGKGLLGKDAEPLMRACVARAQASEQAMAADVRAAQAVR